MKLEQLGSFEHVALSPYQRYLSKSATERKAIIQQVASKNPGRIPIIVDWRVGHISESLALKFLVREEATISEFMGAARKRFPIQQYQGLFAFQGNAIIAPGKRWMELERSPEDGAIHIAISSENCYGAL